MDGVEEEEEVVQEDEDSEIPHCCNTMSNLHSIVSTRLHVVHCDWCTQSAQRFGDWHRSFEY